MEPTEYEHRAIEPNLVWVYAYRCSCGARFATPRDLQQHVLSRAGKDSPEMEPKA